MDFLLLKYAHIIAFVYWLGGDLGTFFASNQVINSKLSPQARATALKIMLACDQGPKMAMPLILALGIHMAYLMQLISTGPWLPALSWLICLWWLGNVLFLYFNEGKPVTQKLASFDLYFRIAVVVVLLALALSFWAGQAWIQQSWVAWKLLIFAALVSCGIFIRINLRPFVPAFAQMMSDGASAQTDQAMQQSLMRCRPFVRAIWVGLFVSAAIGVHLLP